MAMVRRRSTVRFRKGLPGYGCISKLSAVQFVAFMDRLIETLPCFECTECAMDTFGPSLRVTPGRTREAPAGTARAAAAAAGSARPWPAHHAARPWPARRRSSIGTTGGGAGIRCPCQRLQRIGRVQVGQASSAAGKELPQRPAQPQHATGPVPDQRLMGRCHQLDRVRLRRVPPATGRWCAQSSRTISASRCASASDFAPEVECRSRYRATDIGLTPNTS